MLDIKVRAPESLAIKPAKEDEIAQDVSIRTTNQLPVPDQAVIRSNTAYQEGQMNEIYSENEVIKQEKATVAEPVAVNSSSTVSALSLSSIRAKRELEKNKNQEEKQHTELPTEAFSETDMLLIWTKFAESKGFKGQKIIESLLLLNDPKLEGTVIIHELPNEGSRIEFESIKPELLGVLRGKLHNHDISIEVVVNDEISSKKAFTPQDRYNRLREINPNLEVLRKLFDLEI